MTITLTAEIEARIKQEASRNGVDAEEYVNRLIEDSLPDDERVLREQAKANQSTIELLRRWREETATIDPAELERREMEGEQLLGNLARNRMEMDGSEARKLWP